MNVTGIFLIGQAFVAAATLALPWMSQAQFLFAVRVNAPRGQTESARKALRIYYAYDVAGMALTMAWAFAMGLERASTWYLVGVLPAIGAAVGYYRARRHLLPYGAPQDVPAEREADLRTDEDRLPRFVLWAIPPFLLPITGAVYVYAHWSEIPARIAVHYGLNGHPNRWTTRTPLHLYGFFIFVAGLLLLLGVAGIVAYFGSRRSAARRTGLGVTISIMYLMATIFSGAGVWVAHHFPTWMLISIVPPYVAGMLYWMYRRGSAPESPVDSTPDECWSLGDTYNNPNDSALFVPKRLGWGYTVNLGNPQAKWLATGFFSGIALLIGFLFWMQT